MEIMYGDGDEDDDDDGHSNADETRDAGSFQVGRARQQTIVTHFECTGCTNYKTVSLKKARRHFKSCKGERCTGLSGQLA